MRKITFGAGGIAAPPIEAAVRAVQRCEEQGYQAVWWPDHIMGTIPQSLWTADFTTLVQNHSSPHVYLDPFIVIAAAALGTSKIRVGTMVTEAVRHHPAVLAQTILSLDHVSKGRFIAGLGVGEAMNWEPYGFDGRRPTARLEEALQIIRMLWQSDGRTVSFSGQFWELKDAVLGLEPYQAGKYPQIWMAAHGPRTLRLLGKFGDGWLPSRSMNATEYGDAVAAFRQTAVEHGRDPLAITPGLSAVLVLDRDHGTCHRLLESAYAKLLCLQSIPAVVYERWSGLKHPLGDHFGGFTDFIPTRYAPGELEAAIEKVPREVTETFAFHGTPEDVAQELVPYIERGMEHLVIINLTAAIPTKESRPSGGLAREVVRYLSES